MRRSRTPNRRRRQGFTLVEMMMAVFIMTFVSIGLYQFTVDTTHILYTSEQKLDINRDVRTFTSHMSEYARAANTFLIYRSFYERDRDDPSDRVRDGETGDFLLLIYEEPYPTQSDSEHITQLVGYFRRPDLSTGEGPVYRFQIDYKPGYYPDTTKVTPEELIATMPFQGDYKQVLQLARGLADGKLFYNFFDRSIMVKAELIHGSAAQRITDTYNYTVSPRG